MSRCCLQIPGKLPREQLAGFIVRGRLLDLMRASCVTLCVCREGHSTKETPQTLCWPPSQSSSSGDLDPKLVPKQRGPRVSSAEKRLYDPRAWSKTRYPHPGQQAWSECLQKQEENGLSLTTEHWLESFSSTTSEGRHRESLWPGRRGRQSHLLWYHRWIYCWWHQVPHWSSTLSPNTYDPAPG